MTDRIPKLKQLLETDPHDTFCLYSLAQEHAKLGELDTAIDYYDRTLAADPNYLYAYFHKAKALQALDDVEAAKQTLAEGVERARAVNDAKALGELGMLLTEIEEESA